MRSAGAGWNPWRALRARPHLRLVFAPLPGSMRGGIIDGDPRTIVLDDELDQVERNAGLAHELVHDEYDLIWPEDAPPGIVQCGERFVTRKTALRLVPLDQLEAYVASCEAEDEPVHAALVAGEWKVPIDVAHLALRLLQWERDRRSPSHPPGIIDP